MEAVRIIKEMREKTNGTCPARIVWENVPGAFGSNGGEDFRIVLEEITRIAGGAVSIPRPPARYKTRGAVWDSAGLVLGDGWSVAWRVLDSQHWGVPQRRKRIFLVADFRGRSAGEILFKRESVSRHFAESGEAWKRTAGNTQGCAGAAIPINLQIAVRHNALGERTGFGIGKECDPAFTLQEAHHHAVAILLKSNPTDSRINISKDGVVQTLLTSMGTGGNLVPLIMIQNSETGIHPVFCIQGNAIGRSDNAGPNGKGINEDISFTLSATDRHTVAFYSAKSFGKYTADDKSKTILKSDDITTSDLVVTQNYIIRRLTPLECERLQGFPDGWTEYGVDSKKSQVIKIPDSARYRALGNSLAIPCVEFIMGRIAV
jgi:DNA (cytosine-5)-methyltransferase 1